MMAVDFLDQFRDCFAHPGKLKETLYHAMVAVVGTNKRKPSAGGLKCYIKGKVKSAGTGVNPALDPEGPVPCKKSCNLTI